MVNLTFLSFFLILFFDSGISQHNFCNVTVNGIKENLLSKKISIISNQWPSCFKEKDAVMVDEENDAINWKAKSYYSKGKLAFIAETNWQNKDKVSRITIVDNKIKTVSGVCIGQAFGEISSKVSPKIPTEPDGYLSLVDKEDESIRFVLNIKKYPKLFYGVKTLDQIPKSVLIESIVVVETK
jgi:hypothetical protein